MLRKLPLAPARSDTLEVRPEEPERSEPNAGEQRAGDPPEEGTRERFGLDFYPRARSFDGSRSAPGEVESPEAELTRDATVEGRNPTSARAHARVGTTVRDKWHLDALLGVGGMACVYAATHRNGSRAAVKILHPEMSANAPVRERFLWEGYVANAVRHSGAVKVIDDDIADDGSLYLVTELLDGETLEERRVRFGGRIPQAEVLLVIDQLLDVLVAAHAAGIVHRDVKPDNLFLTRTGQVKVLDFGIARMRRRATSKSITQTGLTIGTPTYMAPEQARGLSDQVDERTDLWACGATMFCLLSGRGVPEGRTADEQLANAMVQHAPPLSSAAPDAEAAVAALVDRALAFSKEMRWPTAARMQDALQQVYEELYGAPIATAPQLTLGDGIPDHTLQRGRAISPSPDWKVRGRAPCREAPSRPLTCSRNRRTKRAAMVAGVALGLGAAVLSIATIVAAGYRGGGLQRPSRAVGLVTLADSGAGAMRPLRLVEPSPSRPASRAPAARDSRFMAKRRDPSSATAPMAVPTSRADCRPPYVVDAVTGKKRWKLECL